MKAPIDAFRAERMVLLAWRVAHGDTVTRAYIEREFGVSRATAKRDAALLARVLRSEVLGSAFQLPRRITRGRVVQPLGAE